MTQTLPADFRLSKPPVRDRARYAEHQRRVYAAQHEPGDRNAGNAVVDQSLPPATALGARLRELRVAAGLNQGEMAVRIGYARNNGGRVSDWELGYIMPTLPILYRYSQALGVTVSKILDGVL